MEGQVGQRFVDRAQRFVLGHQAGFAALDFGKQGVEVLAEVVDLLDRRSRRAQRQGALGACSARQGGQAVQRPDDVLLDASRQASHQPGIGRRAYGDRRQHLEQVHQRPDATSLHVHLAVGPALMADRRARFLPAEQQPGHVCQRRIEKFVVARSVAGELPPARVDEARRTQVLALADELQHLRRRGGITEHGGRLGGVRDRSGDQRQVLLDLAAQRQEGHQREHQAGRDHCSHAQSQVRSAQGVEQGLAQAHEPPPFAPRAMRSTSGLTRRPLRAIASRLALKRTGLEPVSRQNMPPSLQNSRPSPSSSTGRPASI